MEMTQHILAVLVLAFAGLVQGTVGFAFALVSVPLLLYLYDQPHQAIAVMSVCSIFTTAAGVRHLRAHVPWRQIVLPVVVVAATLPVGVWLLARAIYLELTVVRQMFGGILLLALAVAWLGRVRPRDCVHWGWTVLASSAGGVIGGLSGMGGPPIVLWATAHRWSSGQMRSALMFQFLCFNAMHLALLWWRFGPVVTTAARTALLYVPVVLLGTAAGLWIGHHLPSHRLRQSIYVLLLLLALSAVLGPIL